MKILSYDLHAPKSSNLCSAFKLNWVFRQIVKELENLFTVEKFRVFCKIGSVRPKKAAGSYLMNKPFKNWDFEN